MQNIFDFNGSADAALMGGQKANDALGFTNPSPTAGLRAPSPQLLESQQRLDQMRGQLKAFQPAQTPTEPMVGYNPTTKRLFSGGHEFDPNNNADLIRANSMGAFDYDNSGKLPQGYSPAPASQFKQKVAGISDFQKEMGSSLRSYGANMALVGHAVTGSEGMLDTYKRLQGESDVLSQADSAPHSWDEVKFGENFLPYVRQLGVQSVPYMAEAMLTGFGLGSALKGMGIQAAKATAERAIMGEAAQIVAKNTVNGVARISQEDALIQAAKNVGSTYARSAGTVLGTYPSSVGDVLSNQMEQTGKIDPTSAALLGVPYAGLNLLGGEGLIAGTNRGIERALGVNTMGKAARAGAAAGLTMGGEAFNESGQEVMNQAGRVAVDPNASMFSPDALNRYKESAIGGALLGGFAGAGAATHAYRSPAEQPVTPQLLDANDNAQQARVQLEYDRQQQAIDQSRGTGGENFAGPTMPATKPVAAGKANPGAVTEDPNLTPHIDSLLNSVNPELLSNAKARALAADVVSSGLSADPKGERVLEALSNGKIKQAEALLRVAKKEIQDARNAAQAGQVPAGADSQSGADATGGQPTGGPDAANPGGGVGGSAAGNGLDNASGAPVGAAGESNFTLSEGPGPGATRGPALTGIDAPENFALTRTGGAPSMNFLAQQEQEAPAPKQTNNTSVENMRETGQQPLFIDRSPITQKPAPKIRRPGSAVQRQWDKVAEKVGLPAWHTLTPEVQAQATEMYKKSQLTPGGISKLKDAFSAMAAQKNREEQGNEFITGVDQVPELRLWNAVFGEAQGPVMERLARGESFEAVSKTLGVTGDAVRKTIERLNIQRVAEAASSVLKPEEAAAIVKSVEYIKKPASKRRFEAAAAQVGGAEQEFATPDQAKDILTQVAGIRVQSAGNMGVKESTSKKTEGNVSQSEGNMVAKAAALEEKMKALLKEGKKEEAAAVRKQIADLATAMYGRAEKKVKAAEEEVTEDDYSDEVGDEEDYMPDATESADAMENDDHDYTRRNDIAWSLGADMANEDDVQTDFELRQLDFAGAVDYAIDNARSKFEKAVMTLVKNRMHQLEKLGFKFEFKVTPKGYSLRGSASGVSMLKIAGLGDSTVMTVTLNGADNGKYSGTNQETLMHELIHAVTQAQIKYAPNGSAAAKLKALFDLVVADFNTNAKRGTLDAFGMEIYQRKNNALESPDELLTWGLTNARMQAYLNSKRTGGKTWFGKLVSAINSALGMQDRVANDSVLAELLTLTEDLMTEDLAPYVTLANQHGHSMGRQANNTGHAPGLLLTVSPGQTLIWSSGDIGLIRGKTRAGADVIVPVKANANGAFKGVYALDHASWDKDNTFTKAELANLRAVAAGFTTSVAPSRGAFTQRLPAQLQVAPRNISETLKAWGQTALNTVAFTEDLIARAVSHGVKAAERYATAEKLRATKAGERIRAAEKILEPFNDLSSKEQKDANDFLYSSTREDKWGFQPSWLSDPVEVDAAMAAKYKALTPAAKKFVESVFRHGHDVLADKKALVRQSVNEEFDADIAAAKGKGNDKLAKRLQSEKDSILERFHTLMRLRDNKPYAPLRRTGDWVVAGRSAQYASAEKAGDTATMHALETDPNHYTVSFAETEGEARQMARDLEDAGMVSSHRQKDAVLEEMYGGKGMMGALLKVKSQLEGMAEDASEDEKKALSKMQRTVATMYLNALSDASARKAEMHRKGIAGDVDMVKSFAGQARADAQFMASIEFNKQILDAVKAMKKEAFDTSSGDPAAKSKLYNEIMKRYVGTLDDKQSKFADRVTRATSVWMLVTSPAYHFFNLTQPFVMSVPYMAKAQGYAASAAALTKAWGEVASMVKSVNWKHSLDFGQIKDAGERAAMENLAKLGVIDIGMSSELGSFQVADKGKFTKAWNKTDDALRVVAQKVETINRLSTAMAAYRLELARTGDPKAAEAYAGKVVTQTHGDYSRANAPRAFNSSFGRIALQFRKFQLIQITMVTKMVKEMFAGASKEEKLAAARAFGFLSAHMAVLGGMVALPGYALWSAIAAGLLGDEGPDDLEQMVRRAVGNKHIADLLTRGVPAFGGVDISSKIGFGNMLSVLPFTDIDPTSRKSITEVGYALTTGAAGGLALRGGDALKHIRNGDYYRGLESAMPSGVMNGLKAARVATQGVTNSKGDILLSPQEVNAAKAFAIALGFTPTSEARRQASSSFHYEQDTYFRERANSLARQYTEALRTGKSPQPIFESWKAMQDAQRSQGLIPAPFGTLYKAPLNQQVRERNTSAEGVQFRKSNRAAVLGDAQ